jgi:hypothetical protein
MEGTYLLAMRCPVHRVTLIRAFVRNLRTWAVMGREKHKWMNHEAERTHAPTRVALLHSSDEAA